MMRFLAPVAVLFSPITVFAQDEAPTPQELAFAAGYKAMFTCSATFNAKKTPEQIAEDELQFTYDVYEALFDDVGAAEIDESERIVFVRYSEQMPARMAVHRGLTGCIALPVGGTEAMIPVLPKVELERPTRSPDLPWPTGDRLPNDLPISIDEKRALDAVVQRAFDADFMGRTSAVVILKNGEIVAEQYKDGFSKDTSQRTWSVAKSIAASIIGAAVQDGLIDIKDRADLEAWSTPGDPRAAITVENLLHMSSGLNSDPAGNRTDEVYLGGAQIVQQATKAGLDAAPGTRWRYANNDTMLAMRALRERMEPSDYLAYPFTALLHKIGMDNTRPETDWNGDFVLSSQVWTTARDLARLGQLYLQDGMWEGERLLPEGWSDYVAAPAPAQPWGDAEEPEDGHRGYGAQFWRYLDYPGVPNDTYAALGNRGQFLIIVPSEEVVIVRRGYDYRGNYFDGPGFTAAVLEALK